jgi:hypothetical protein
MERKPRPVVDLSATCACGGVQVAIKGKIHAMFLCSCEDCQRATGSGHSSVAIADPDDVTITGEVRSFTRPANSGATFTRHFCPVCGTPIYGQSSRAPDAMMFPVGLFGAATDWFVPNQLIFARSHRDWDVLAEHLPRYRTYRDEEAVL